MHAAPEAPARGLRGRQDAVLLGAVLLAVGAFVGWNRVTEYRAIEAEQRHLLAAQAAAIDVTLSRQVTGIDTALRILRDDLAAVPPADWPAQATRRLEVLSGALGGLHSMLLLDAGGRVVAAGRREWVGRDLSAQQYVRAARSDPADAATRLSPPEADPDGAYTMHLSLPVGGADGAPGGLLVAALDPKALATTLRATLYATDAWAGVAHGGGRLMAMEPPRVATHGAELDQPGSMFRRHLDSGQADTVFVGDVRATGERRMLAHRTVRPAGVPVDKPLVVAVSRSVDAMFAPWRRHTALYAVLYAAFAGTTIAAQLAIRRRQRALERLESEGAERLALALRGADLGLWDLDVRSGDSIVNERWNSMLGLPHEPVNRNSQAWYTRIHPDDRARVEAAQRAHFEGRSARFDETYRMRHADGRWVWVLDRGQVLERDATGAPLRVAGTHLDVTEPMERQLALQAQQRRLQALLDHLRTGVIVHAPDGSVLDANPAARAMTGLTLDQLRGMAAVDPYWSFVDEAGAPLAPAHFPVARVIASGKPVHDLVIGFRHPGRPGPTWVLVDAYAMAGPDGLPEQVVVTFSDITDRRDAAQQLQATLEAVPDLLFDIDLDGTFHAFHSPRRDLLYARPEDFLGRRADEFLPAASVAVLKQALAEADAQGTSIGHQYHLQVPGGQRWFELSVSRKATPAGERPRFIVLARDITARRQAEQELRHLNRSLRVLSSCNMNLLEQRDEASYLAEVCRSVVAAGSYLMAWAGSAEDDAAKTVRVVAQAGDDSGYLQSLVVSWDGERPNGRGPTGTAIRTGTTQVNQNWLTDPVLGPWRHLALARGYQASIALPLVVQGRTVGALSLYAAEPNAFGSAEVAPLEELARNVSVGIESLRTRHQRDAAEGANRAKSVFLANMSHEIRTPLNAIIGLNYLVRRDGVAPQQLARLDKIDSAGQHLLSIVNDILDLSKIEAGRMQLESTSFHLSTVLDNVRSIVAESARAKGLAIEVDENAVPHWLRGDPTRLRQALLNFAANAVKFTERGSIALRAKLLHEDGDDLLVRFAVVDTGIGIAAEDLPRLFQAFEQADPSTTRRFGGSGLGLAITQRLAELMGGECGVDSRVGEGSTFWFTARLKRGHGVMPALPRAGIASAESVLRQRHRGARVLLAEDNEVNREVALALLHGVGLAVEVAVNGREAVERAAAGAPDLVLMDLQMPEMSGLEATRAIRALPGGATLPILALTANAFDEDRQACSAAGMNDFVAKPMDVPAFYATLLHWLDASQAARGRAAAAPGPAPAPPAGLPAAATLQRLASVQGLDLERGLAAVLGNAELYVGVLARFATGQELAALRTALGAGRRADAERAAHSMRGAASTLGHDAIAALAGEAEVRLRGADDAAVSTALVADLLGPIEAHFSALAAVAETHVAP